MWVMFGAADIGAVTAIHHITSNSLLVLVVFFFRRLDLDLRFCENVLFELRELEGADGHDAFAALKTFGDLNVAGIANAERDALLMRFVFRSTTMTEVFPEGLVSTAACGMMSAFGTVFAIISTRMLVPG